MFEEDYVMSTAEYDRREAQMGAAWKGDVLTEWLSTDRDVWVPNPQYQGPICPCHPEQDPRDATPTQWDTYAEEFALYVAHMEEAEHRYAPDHLMLAMEDLWPERY